MTLLIIGLVLFLGIHSLSIVAIIGLALIVQGYGQARLDPTVLYVPPE